MSKIPLEKIWIISSELDNSISWEFDNIKDELYHVPEHRLDSSFLKGLQDFVNDLSKDSDYCLIIADNLFVGKMLQIDEKRGCYLVLVFKQAKPKKSKKINLFSVNFFTKFEIWLQQGKIHDLFDTDFASDLKRYIHKIIRK